MKIDIGAEGKILGTKRVSPNGQVSGLSEYAGEEVLIIYPGPREPRIRMQAGDYVHEVEKAVAGQMKVAFQQYKALKVKYRTRRRPRRSSSAPRARSPSRGSSTTSTPGSRRRSGRPRRGSRRSSANRRRRLRNRLIQRTDAFSGSIGPADAIERSLDESRFAGTMPRVRRIRLCGCAAPRRGGRRPGGRRARPAACWRRAGRPRRAG